MKAFHNDPKIKAMYLARVRAHRAADELIKGRYWNKGKGCAVGCTVHSGEHNRYEKELGIPEVLAHLEDRIFENLPNELAHSWPERFLSAPEVGADLSLVWPKFAVWLLVDKEYGVLRHALLSKDKEVISTVATLWQRVVDGETVGDLKEEFDTAYAAAYAACDAACAANAANAANAAANVAAYAAANAAAYATDANAAANAANAAYAAYAANAAHAAYAAYAADAAHAAHAGSDAASDATNAYDNAYATADPTQSYNFIEKCSDKLISLMSVRS